MAGLFARSRPLFRKNGFGQAALISLALDRGLNCEAVGNELGAVERL